MAWRKSPAMVLYEKCWFYFRNKFQMFESEVHAEFTWPPRPVVEGESFRVSRASSGIRKGAAYTPMPKHWPEENSMHSKQESAELYGTVLKARDKRLAQMHKPTKTEAAENVVV